jgi:nitroreductase
VELTAAVRTRRTVRTYLDKPVPDELTEALLRESTRAPSACNIRGWRFIVIRDTDQLRWLYENGSAAFIKDAPQSVLVCYDNRTENSAWNDNEQSAAAAITCFQLLAHEQGIGSCWICHLPPREEVSLHFGIPVEYSPIALITFGYYRPGYAAEPRDLSGDARMVAYEKWDFAQDVRVGLSGLAFHARKLARRLYYLLPWRGWLRKHTLKYEKKF